MRPACERIRAAMLALVTSQGFEATSVEQVLAAAGARREEFDRCFGSKEECAIAVFEAFMRDCVAEVRAAYESEPVWPDSLRAAAYALARWLDRHPREARFGGLEILWVSELSQARREAALEFFAQIADAGRARAADPAAVPPFTAERVVGAVASMLAKRARSKLTSPYELVPQLMYVAVLPYMGEEAAARELKVPAPGWVSDGH